MAKTKSTARRRAFKEPAPGVGEAPVVSEERQGDIRGLWVVLNGRMKLYGDFKIERPGQIIRKQYLRNDDKLLRHGYVRPLEEGDDTEQCEVCGLVFLGSVTAGPFKAHRETVRHDLAKTDLDTGIRGRDGRVRRTGDIAGDPDSDTGDEWDLEEEGAEPLERLEELNPGGVTVSLGNR